MTKKRVYELAKELGLENRELISRLEKIGIAVKSHSSTLEDGRSGADSGGIAFSRTPRGG